MALCRNWIYITKASHPTTGLYICRKGNTVQKVIVR